MNRRNVAILTLNSDKVEVIKNTYKNTTWGLHKENSDTTFITKITNNKISYYVIKKTIDTWQGGS